MPDPRKLHRGIKLAGRVAVYTHRDARKLAAELAGADIKLLREIPIYALDRTFVEEVTALLDRRSDLTLSITEREIYFGIAGRTLTTSIVEHRASPR
jgi:uncharacterized protein YaeQ